VQDAKYIKIMQKLYDLQQAKNWSKQQVTFIINS